MSHEEGRFSGALGESYWQAWLPERPKAVVLLVHGVSEHTGRYPHVAAKLVEHGYAVYGIDHYGHGRSAGTKGNLGSMTGVVQDLRTLRGIAQSAQPGVPLFIVAHSLGSLIALDLLTTHGQEGFAGLVLSGTAVDPSVGTRIERALAPLISKIAPNLALTDLGIDNISRDPAVVQAYRDDPLVYTGRIRARTGAEALARLPVVVSRLGELTLPILMVHGGDDRITGPNGADIVYAAVGSADKTKKVYDGLFHEIFNEPEQDVVFADVLTWLDARV